VLACPRCGGRMIVLATIDDPAVIARILTHLGRSLDPGDPAPGRDRRSRSPRRPSFGAPSHPPVAPRR
jgi:hypothetical protein